jgi:hypothetical protein
MVDVKTRAIEEASLLAAEILAWADIDRVRWNALRRLALSAYDPYDNKSGVADILGYVANWWDYLAEFEPVYGKGIEYFEERLPEALARNPKLARKIADRISKKSTVVESPSMRAQQEDDDDTGTDTGTQ